MTASESATHDQYLTLFLGDEEYAIGILKVREILEYETLTRVPGAPPTVRGVINLRGAVVPVIDLAVKFGFPESPVTNRTCMVIVEVENGADKAVMGIIADVISQVVDLPAQAIEPPPDFGTKVRLDHLLGMGRIDDKFLLILNIDKVLSPAELSTVAGVHDLLAAEGAAPAAGAEAAAGAPA